GGRTIQVDPDHPLGHAPEIESSRPPSAGLPRPPPRGERDPHVNLGQLDAKLFDRPRPERVQIGRGPGLTNLGQDLGRGVPDIGSKTMLARGLAAPPGARRISRRRTWAHAGRHAFLTPLERDWEIVVECRL